MTPIMNHFSGDPYWTDARKTTTCVECHEKIKPGDRIFVFKSGETFCIVCGDFEYQRFTDAAEAEYAYNPDPGYGDQDEPDYDY